MARRTDLPPFYRLARIALYGKLWVRYEAWGMEWWAERRDGDKGTLQARLAEQAAKLERLHASLTNYDQALRRQAEVQRRYALVQATSVACTCDSCRGFGRNKWDNF